MIILIAAVSDDGYIGKNGKLPWHIPEDLKRFKELTKGHPVIMGRKTWESLPIKPLPERTNYVITRQAGYVAEGAIVVNSLEEAIKKAGKESDRLFIIGGGSIYSQAMKLADVLEITEVHRKVEGDVKFPEIGKEWKEVKREDFREYSFVTYVRR